MLWMSSRELELVWLGNWALGSLHEAHESVAAAVAPALRIEPPKPGPAPILPPHRGFCLCFLWQPYLPLNEALPGLAVFIMQPSFAPPIVEWPPRPIACGMPLVADRRLLVRTGSFVGEWQLLPPPPEAL